MPDFPTYDDLAQVSRPAICGLLDELGTPAWNGTYDHAWGRHRQTWEAVEEALNHPRPARAERHETPPRWLAPLVRERLRDLSTHSSYHDGFAPVRLLERLGLVRLDADDAYVLAFISGVGNQGRDSAASLLRDDPELIDRALWRVFEVEGGGEVSLANVDAYGGCWQQTFLDLVGDGTLPRERVMTSCLGTLRGDFSTYRAAWFSRLYLALSPTLEEMSRHQDAYRHLLGSDVGPTVSFAMKLLGTLLKAGRLAGPETVPALVPVVLGRAKGTATAALTMATTLAEADPGLRPEAIALAGEAVGHPNRDVQAAAVRTLERYGATAAAVARADELAPSLRQSLGLTAEEQHHEEPAVPAVPASTAPPPSLRDDLLERTAALLEDAGDVLEVEALLAGLASTGPTDLLKPLRKRARKPGGGPMSGHIAGLVLTSLGEPVEFTSTHPGPSEFLVRRVVEVARILAGEDRPRTLLATPDTGEGWVTPATLVQRLAAAPDPGTSDLVAALLRLGTEGRAEALGRARQLPGELGQVVRHALGEDVDRADVTRVSWWVAASRARAPLHDDPLLLRHRLDAAGQGRALATGLDFRTVSGTYSDRGGRRSYTHYYWRVTVEQGCVDLTSDQPTADRRRGEWTPELEDLVGHLAAIWPHDAEHFLAHSCLTVFDTTDAGPWRDAVRVLETLSRHPGRLGGLAAATVAVGLSAGRADQRLTAVDTFHDLVATGRISPDALADAMVLTAGHCTATRWASSLRDASATGPGARAAVATLTALLPRLQPGRQGLHALLDVLHEESLRHGIAVTDPALRSWLQSFSGSSKSARAAQALLA